jgi:hypothetical protein
MSSFALEAGRPLCGMMTVRSGQTAATTRKGPAKPAPQLPYVLCHSRTAAPMQRLGCWSKEEKVQTFKQTRRSWEISDMTGWLEGQESEFARDDLGEERVQQISKLEASGGLRRSRNDR